MSVSSRLQLILSIKNIFLGKQFHNLLAQGPTKSNGENLLLGENKQTCLKDSDHGHLGNYHLASLWGPHHWCGMNAMGTRATLPTPFSTSQSYLLEASAPV